MDLFEIWVLSYGLRLDEEAQTRSNSFIESVLQRHEPSDADDDMTAQYDWDEPGDYYKEPSDSDELWYGLWPLGPTF